MQPSEHHIRIGYRRLGAASPVGGGARLRPRAARADPKAAPGIHMGDGSPARSDAVDVDHRGEQRIAGNPCVASACLAKSPIRDDADIGRGAAHVECDQAITFCDIAGPGAAEDSRRRTRQQGHHRTLRHHLRGRHAPVRAHDVEVRAQPFGLDLARQPLDVAPHLGADEGIHGGGGEALELPELGRDRR